LRFAVTSRVGFVMALTLFPISAGARALWNWYGFPVSFTLAESITHTVGFFVGGLVLARLVTNRQPGHVTASRS